jgi:hypothetical protein
MLQSVERISYQQLRLCAASKAKLEQILWMTLQTEVDTEASEAQSY